MNPAYHLPLNAALIETIDHDVGRSIKQEDDGSSQLLSEDENAAI